MSKNSGKKFEELIKLSAEEQGIDYNRMKDAGYTGSAVDGRRFTVRNICDCTLFNGYQLIYTEIKERKSSITFESITQLDSLVKKWKPEQGVFSGVFIRFSDANTVVFIATPSLIDMQKNTGKKSFNLVDAMNYGYAISMVTPPRKRTARPNLSGAWYQCRQLAKESTNQQANR